MVCIEAGLRRVTARDTVLQKKRAAVSSKTASGQRK